MNLPSKFKLLPLVRVSKLGRGHQVGCQSRREDFRLVSWYSGIALDENGHDTATPQVVVL